MKVYDSQTAHFPVCDICFKSLHRPCSIEAQGKVLTVCAGCYALHRRLMEFERVGLIEGMK